MSKRAARQHKHTMRKLRKRAARRESAETPERQGVESVQTFTRSRDEIARQAGVRVRRAVLAGGHGRLIVTIDESGLTVESKPLVSESEPVAWAVTCPPFASGDFYFFDSLDEAREAREHFDEDAAERGIDDWRSEIVPLYVRES